MRLGYWCLIRWCWIDLFCSNYFQLFSPCKSMHCFCAAPVCFACPVVRCFWFHWDAASLIRLLVRIVQLMLFRLGVLFAILSSRVFLSVFSCMFWEGLIWVGLCFEYCISALRPLLCVGFSNLRRFVDSVSNPLIAFYFCHVHRLLYALNGWRMRPLLALRADDSSCFL